MNPITSVSNLIGSALGRETVGPQAVDTASSGGSKVERQAQAPQRGEMAADAPSRDESEAIQKALENAGEAFRDSALSLDFRVDEDTEQVIITVRDSNTDEVIRQIPPEERVQLARALEAVAQGETDGLPAGVLTDQRV